MAQTADLLFELGTEELPPKALKAIAEALLKNVSRALDDTGITYQQNTRLIATPRRIGFILPCVETARKDQYINKEGPFIDKAYDNKRQPTKAALGFAASCGVPLSVLTIISHKKGKRLFYRVKKQGEKTVDILPQLILKSLKKLPIPKMMRWGAHDFHFVRPVHSALCLFGSQTVDFELFGVKTKNTSFGHRFHAPSEINIPSAEDYFKTLEKKGHVIAEWQARKDKLLSEISAIARSMNAEVIFNDELVDEVNAIVEWPCALFCRFSKHLLRVPQEALILSIQTHQKCFPLKDQNGRLLPYFITVSNIDSKNRDTVISGNNKVMAARLADAEFFYNSDIQHPLEDYLPRLKTLTFEKRLGTMYERTLRIAESAKSIAKRIGADPEISYEAGMLAKADLMSDMVFEFPDLQGIMGKYYAQVHGKSELICESIEQQYWPKFAGDQLPVTSEAQAVALAEKLDTLVGIFSIDQKPTGDKDPFALRRAAIGVLRILKEKQLAVSLSTLIDIAIATYKGNTEETMKKSLIAFFIDRLKALYKAEGLSAEIFASVSAVRYKNILDFDRRIEVVKAFLKTPVAARLSMSNKRVANILAKNHFEHTGIKPDKKLLKQPEEQNLYQAIETLKPDITQQLENDRYHEILTALGKLDAPLNLFFDKVMVMDKDLTLQKNRLALLNELNLLFKQVADIAKLP